MKEIATALAKAQAEIKAPVKNCKVDYTHNGQRTKYSYADLASVIAAITPSLSKHGLSISHCMGLKDGHFGMETILLHTSGETLSTWYPLPNPENMNPQKFGSSLTYSRRYSVSCLVGISSEEDDDGATAEPPKVSAAVQNLVKTKPQPRGGVQDGPLASTAQIKRIAALIHQREISDSVFNTYLSKVYAGVTSGNMRDFQAREIIELLNLDGTSEATLMAECARKDGPKNYAPGAQN